MSIFGLSKTYRRYNRVLEILQVLIRHGFGHYVRRMNLEEKFPRVGGWLSVRTKLPMSSEDQSEESLGRRIACVAEELGTSFIKLGQVLSSRPDLVAEEVTQELRKLQDRVEPFTSEEAIRIVEEEFGQPLGELFQDFEEQPFASGSVAQAHYAVLEDGSEVVVKIRRPGIEEKLFVDLYWLKNLAELAERYIEEIRPYRPTMVVEEYERTLRKELDFVVEGSQTARFQRLFASDPEVNSPRVYWELTSSKVLTMERIKGENISRWAEKTSDPLKRRILAKNLASAFCRQYFEFGAFHADPHPGNLLVSDNGKLNFVDFGICGHLSNQLRENLSQTLVAAHKRELEIFCELFADMGATTDATDFRELQSSLTELLNKYYSMPLRYLDTVQVFQDVTRVARQNGMVLPRDVVLLAKSFVSVMTTAKNLDPDFDFAAAVEPHVSRLVMRRFAAANILEEAKMNFWHASRLFRLLPREITEIVRKISSGRLQMVFRHEGLEHFTNELDRSLNRLSFSIIIAAIVIASSLLLESEVRPLIFDNVSLLGLMGYVVAGFLGVGLAIAIWRSGRI